MSETTWAIIPARSGSKGLPGKNIKLLDGVPLIGHAINFAKRLKVDRILLTTDSEEYAQIGREFGAFIPFLRSAEASTSTAMEQDILIDIEQKLKSAEITPPDKVIWLRPTFPFRSLQNAKSAISQLTQEFSASRIVIPAENRLYRISNDVLEPTFEDNQKSMMRRQDMETFYSVFHTDVFWWNNLKMPEQFLGSKIKPIIGDRIEGIDIDDEFDFVLAENIIASVGFAQEYTHHEHLGESKK